ncbi:DUF4843 domain-containing protein [Chitinophaga sedimenti]|uniref:DUF4843 domain-containing protein n=1 Tax=Chitinophaga sedimenti TaxID=2033606 RepID=UPI0020057F4B|nr:DUF4843 domain-containing protein [Chitinophaga sedimenti]MCK7557784.1 DUF4843 domain-containing protein [Chitinophaga sedimenti]
MKHLLTLVLICSVCCFSCKKSDQEQVYTSPDNIYFDFVNPVTNVRTDSVTFSFALFPDKASDTVWLPVRISGIRQSVNRVFKLGVIDSATTAVAGKHYEALKAEYILPADSGKQKVPIILLNTDPALKTGAVRLKLKLVESADFGANQKGWDTAKVIFSNQLVKPIWWDVWGSMLGSYSRVRHELFYISTKATSLPETNQDWQVTPLVLTYGRVFAGFLRDAQLWIDTHKDEGYVLETISATKKEFYSKGNPSTKYTYQLNTADNTYYFMDESGNRVIPAM